MSHSHLYFSREGASKLLARIKVVFPEFYKKHTGNLFVEDVKRESHYWENQVGQFLRGQSKQDQVYTKSGEPNQNVIRKRLYDKPYLSADKIVLTDAKVLYEELFCFIKKPTKTEAKIRSSTIEGLFVHFFTDAADKDPLTFGTWTSQIDQTQSGSLKSSQTDSQDCSLYYSELAGRSWSLFNFWESHDESDPSINSKATGKKLYGIRHSFIEFDTEKQITIGNIIENDGVDYYKGEYYFRKEKELLYLETEPLRIDSERYFRLMFYFGSRRINELAIGVYYNIRKLGSLVSGSALLVETPDKFKDSIKNSGCVVYTDWHEVPSEFSTVRQFLERRSLNYIKLPSNINYFRIGELQSVLDNLKEKENEWNYRLYKYDYFLAIPLTYNNSEELYLKNAQLGDKLISFITKESPQSRPYAASQQVKTLTHFNNLADKNRYKRALEAIEQSRNFIWLYPKFEEGLSSGNHISSSIIELGYAMGLKKPILVFYDHSEEKHLPKILKDYNQSIGIPFDSESPDGLKDSFEANLESIKGVLKFMDMVKTNTL